MPRVSWQASWPPWQCTASELAVLIPGRRVERPSRGSIRSQPLSLTQLLQPPPIHPGTQPISPTPAAFRTSAPITASQLGFPSGGLTLHPLPRPLQSEQRGVAQLGSAGALGALGRRFESCRPDHSHSKGSRPFRGPSFLACFGVMCARCAQKKRGALRCSVFCAQRCAEPGGVLTWLDLSLRMVWVASPASTWPAPADAICHHQPGLRQSERHGHPNHPDVGMRPPRPRLSRSE